MALTPEDIAHIAGLARIGITPEESDAMAHDLSSILEYVEQLAQVDTSGLEYHYQVDGLQNVARTDVATPCSDEQRGIVLDDMPERSGDLLRVPGVFE